MDVTKVPGKLVVLALFLLTACIPPQVVQPPTPPPGPTVSIEPTGTSGPTVTVMPKPATTVTSMPEPPEQVYETMQRLIRLNKQGALNSADAKELFAGELANWDAPTIGEIISEPDPIVMLNPTSAVTRVQVMAGYTFDAYLYLSLDSTWRITAMRAMALPGFVRQMYVELRNKKDLAPDETKLLDEITPLFLTDKAWRDWFSQNRHSLEAICIEATKKLSNDVYSITQANIGGYPDIEEAFTALGIQSVESEGSGNIQITTAGILDNSVGFICSPRGTPPSMSPSGFIWIEEVEEGWYLFRTT